MMRPKSIRVAAVASGIVMLCFNAAAQSPRISIEGATVRQNTEPSATVRLDVSGSALTVRAYPLLGLIIGAYHLEPYQVIGGPGWMTTDRFDVNALVAVADNKELAPS